MCQRPHIFTQITLILHFLFLVKWNGCIIHIKKGLKAKKTMILTPAPCCDHHHMHARNHITYATMDNCFKFVMYHHHHHHHHGIADTPWGWYIYSVSNLPFAIFVSVIYASVVFFFRWQWQQQHHKFSHFNNNKQYFCTSVNLIFVQIFHCRSRRVTPTWNDPCLATFQFFIISLNRSNQFNSTIVGTKSN